MPAAAIARVPVVVMGDPLILKPPGTDAATLVTVPVPRSACQVACVESVATRAWPATGAVAADTSTVVVADLSAIVMPDVNPEAVPVTLVITPDAGVPKRGPISVGPLLNTTTPVPVSSVIAAEKLALEGAAKNVAMPVPKPEILPTV